MGRELIAGLFLTGPLFLVSGGTKRRFPTSVMLPASIQASFAGMTAPELESAYHRYLACLNAQAWSELGAFVHDEVVHNGRRLGLAGYRDMLKKDFMEIPDLHFQAELLIVEPPRLASRLRFDCTPRATFLGLDVNGSKVSFTENVMYRFADGKIVEVWSVVDKAAIEAQLVAPVRGSAA